MIVEADGDVGIFWIVVHCSDSPEGRGDDAAEIHRWHLRRKWHGIGYHHVILEDGTVQDGRPHYWKGAHVGEYNHCSLGVCLIGRSEFSQPQIRALYMLVKRLQAMYPDAVVCGHRDLDPAKMCPNFDVREMLAKFEVAENYPRTMP